MPVETGIQAGGAGALTRCSRQFCYAFLVQPRYDLFGKQFHRALAFGRVEAGQMHPEDEMRGAYIFRELLDLTSDFLRGADHRTGQ